MYAVAWKCLVNRGWTAVLDSFCEKPECERGLVCTDRETANAELLVKDACGEGEVDVTKPRAVLGLAADNGALNAELFLGDRSIIAMAVGC